MARVFLGPIDLDNDRELEFHVESRNTDAIMKWCRQYKPLTLQEHKNHLANCQKDGKRIFFNVFLEDMENGDVFPDRSLIGMTGLTDIDLINRRAEFSLWINEAYHGQGYGKQALSLIFQFGFNDLNLHSIWGETFEGNPAAIMFDKLGMAYEGSRRDFYYKNGIYLDAHLYSIKKNEFIKRY
jgi:RimJ/RimL family protein N-acetyltransferase